MVDILRGLLTATVLKHRHHEIKSFNAENTVDEKKWYSIYRQLIAGGVLKTEMNGSSKLELTANALPILDGKNEIWLRQDDKSVLVIEERAPRIPRTKRKRPPPEEPKIFNDSSKSLFENLKIFRTELAKKRKTRAYKIFPDKTLMILAEKKPSQIHELEGIYGIGPKKLKKFGQLFLNALDEFTGYN
jgi:ATP-dependent DNA helicase RecQ